MKPVPTCIFSSEVKTIFEFDEMFDALAKALFKLGGRLSTVSKYKVVVLLIPAYLLPLES
jgi:hypothetical protein